MSSLTNLKALDLSKTSLKELPSFIGTFPNLQYLNLQGCDKLQSLPPTLGHLQRLEHLRLSCCYDICELPDSVCNLHDLRFFDLSRCTELEQLSHLFGNLRNLEDLNLSGCFNLKQLPESFGNLYFLRFLNLSSCYELWQLPGSLTNLRKLEVLILRRCCRLQNLPPSFGKIQYLRNLDLAGCEALQVSPDILTTNLEYLNLQRCRKLQTQPNCFVNFTKLRFLNLSHCLYTIDYLESLGYLFNLEYLNLSQTFFEIPVSFERLQKLHMLDLTGCVTTHPSSGAPQILPDIICKMTGLKFVLTNDPMIVASLPQHIRCSVSIDEHWRITTDELVIPNLTRGSRGLGIAERANLQNRREICFLKLEWIPTSQSTEGDVAEDVGVEEVLEKLQPNQSLEHFEIVGYAGSVFPTWMMSNSTTSLPNLVSLHLFHLENCKNLPPLCELRNLRYLHIKDVPNLRNLEMGLSGGPQPLKKLKHLKLETLLNLEELCILLSTNNEEQFMFPALEELSVVSCCKLMFKPSFPKCLKYEIKDSNNILSCGEPIGPSSSSPVQIEITECRIPSNLLLWLRSLRTLEKAVIDSCVGEDGRVLTSLGLLEIKGNEEPSSSYARNEITTDSSLERIIPHELTTQVGAPTDTGHGSSLFQKPFPWFSTSPEHKGLLRSMSFRSFTASEDPSTISSSAFTQSTDTDDVDETYLKGTILESPNLRVFTILELMMATRKFSYENLLSEDGPAKVYKGWFDKTMNPSKTGDGMAVAIKKFYPEASMELAEPMYCQTEINFLGRLSHPNLVKLLGYCLEDDCICVVSEFMGKGSLANHLFRRGANPLPWSLRVKILIGAARGLAFLHSLEKPIIHRNFKTSNILLDTNYNPKVSDLSFAKEGPYGDMSHVTTRVMGTYGYAAPEYVATDAGKSTAGGQILFLSGQVDERTIQKYEKEAKDKSRESWYMAYVMDTNEEERAKGKTVEVGRAHFETENTRFTILDAPGHKSYVPNMISGASQADIGVLVISARKGEFETGYERGGQTREHVLLAKTLGISKLVVVINKMDDPTVGWSKERYDEIEGKMTPFLKTSGYNVKKDVQFLPISGLLGTNMKTQVDKSICSWWNGPCLFDILDCIEVPLRDPKGPVRMPIIDKYKDMGTVVMGKIESGTISEGDNLLVMPNKANVKVISVYCDEDKVRSAAPGENVRVKLSGIEEEDITAGFVLSSIANPVGAVSEFNAQLQILELLDNAIFTAGYKAVLHIHSVVEECEIVELIEEIDLKRKKESDPKKKKPKRKPLFVKNGAVVVCRVQVNNLICIENFSDFPQLGRFTLRTEGKTVAIGKIVAVPPTGSSAFKA